MTTSVDTPESLLWEEVANGDCYEAAVNLILGEATLGKNQIPDFSRVKSLLVQAEVTGQGKILGVKYGHAWVERGGMVLDFSNGRHLVIPKSKYYALGHIVDAPGKLYRYTGLEVKKWLMKTKHYGPWELETESGY